MVTSFIIKNVVFIEDAEFYNHVDTTADVLVARGAKGLGLNEQDDNGSIQCKLRSVAKTFFPV